MKEGDTTMLNPFQDHDEDSYVGCRMTRYVESDATYPTPAHGTITPHQR